MAREATLTADEKKAKQKAASMKWTKANIKNLSIGLRYGQDDDIIEHLESKKNKQAYIKELIRRDIG